MIILDQLEKLINEHGSAPILRDHVALLKEQVLLLEKRLVECETKVSVLTQEKEVLTREHLELTAALKKSVSHAQDLTVEVENLNAVSQQTHADSDYDLFNH